MSPAGDLDSRAAGGQPNSEHGHGIPDVRVALGYNFPRSDHERVFVSERGILTDKHGRWQNDWLPRDILSILRIEFHHPGYVDLAESIAPGPDYEFLKAGRLRTKLQTGVRIEGHVVREDGSPVEGAVVRRGSSPDDKQAPLRSDETGRFRVPEACTGSLVLTVQAPGHAPELRELTVRPGMDPLEIRLGPARTIRGRVLDRARSPVAGALVEVSRWRGHASLRTGGLLTDGEGRFEWRDAPGDVVLFDVVKKGCMSLRNHPMLASEEERVIVLNAPLQIRGRVLDAETGEPIPHFEIHYGLETAPGRNSWFQYGVEKFSGGLFEKTIDMPLAAYQYAASGYVLKAKAPGFLPAVTRPFQDTEGVQDAELRLRRSRILEPRGVVLDPTENPAGGALVFAATPAAPVVLREGEPASPAAVVRADREHGAFALPAHEGDGAVVALHDSGWCEASLDDLDRTRKIVLQPWGRITGTLLDRGNPLPSARVEIACRAATSGLRCVQTMEYHRITGLDGSFRFDRLLPGTYRLRRVVETPRGWAHWGRPQDVQVRAGSAVRTVVDGTGVTVTGRAMQDSAPPEGRPWDNARISLTPLAREPFGEAVGIAALPSYSLRAGMDGSFRLDGVAPGTYELRIEVREPRTRRTLQLRDRLALLAQTVEVNLPESNRHPAVVDLGRIPVPAVPRLEVGDPAPAFTVRALDGGTLSLSDFAGRYVLLEFWASWCGPCRVQIPHLKRVHEQFGASGKLVVIGMNLDSEAASAERFVAAHGVGWRHGLLGDWKDSPLRERYRIDGIPRCFLIDPDGKIAAKNLLGEEVLWTVMQVLPNEGK